MTEIKARMYPLHPRIHARSEQGQRGLNYQMSTAQAVKLNTCHGRACVADNCRVNSSTVPLCIDYVSLRELSVQTPRSDSLTVLGVLCWLRLNEFVILHVCWIRLVFWQSLKERPGKERDKGHEGLCTDPIVSWLLETCFCSWCSFLAATRII